MVNEPQVPTDLSAVQVAIRQGHPIGNHDWQELMAAQQKNWEALGQANKVWFEGTQKVVQREITSLYTDESLKFIRANAKPA